MSPAPLAITFTLLCSSLVVETHSHPFQSLCWKMSPASCVPPCQHFPRDCPSTGSSLPHSEVSSSLLPCGHVPTAVPKLSWGLPMVLGSWLPQSPTTLRSMTSTIPTRNSTTSLSFTGRSHPEHFLQMLVHAGHPPGALRSSASPEFLLLSQLEDSSSTSWPQPS